MNDIYVQMHIPQLGSPEFQQEFSEFCSAMKQNIERLISIQYSKGEPGNSIYTETDLIKYTIDGDSVLLSPMGRKLVETIFDESGQHQWLWDMSNDRDFLYEKLTGNPADIDVDGILFIEDGLAPSIFIYGKEYSAIPDLLFPKDNPTGISIEINVDKKTGRAFLSSPYIFIDGRIAGLNMVYRQDHDEEYYKRFHDFSAAIYGGAEYSGASGENPDDPLTWNWTLKVVHIVPKLYFDEEVNEFCWDVNGQQTGVTAQGIKGDDGVSPNTFIAIGEYNDGNINISRFMYVDDNGQQWANVMDPEQTDIIQPKDGDMALVYYPDAIGTNPYANAYFGRVFISPVDGPYVVIGSPDGGRCDVFESIRMHDFWRLMMSINENTPGMPRGYILPAEPTRECIMPNDQPTKVHMTYSERNSQDGQGWAKLHSSPVVPAVTQGNHNNNPVKDHTGEWEVDYNMSVQGSLGVQDNLRVNGETELHDTMVQGNLQVQGSVISNNITIVGQQFETKIDNTLLSCMSKFKNVNYKLSRVPSKVNNSISYSLAISGVLELNVGSISAYNKVGSLHGAIGGYQENWTDGSSADDAFSDIFARSPSPVLRSKMYRVVTYNIPFSLTKTGRAQINVNGNTGDDDIFNFGSSSNSDYNSVWAENNVDWQNGVSIRLGALGSVQGIRRGGKANLDIDADQGGSVVETSLREATNGAVSCITQFMDNINDDLTDNYTISGKIHYAPLNKDINYCFDIFSRILELDAGGWVQRIHQSTTYKTIIRLTPVGCLYFTEDGNRYMTPIWNALNTQNIGLTTIYSISRLNRIGRIGGIVLSDDQKETHYTVLFPLIQDTVEGTWIYDVDESINVPVNGPTGIISSGNNLDSDYMVSIFDYRNQQGIQPYNTNTIETTYFDMTHTMMVASDNLKICPNNAEDGVWTLQGNHRVYWTSNNPVVVSVIPYEGFIGDVDMSSNQGAMKLGCGSPRVGTNKPSISLQGLLMFPYTPCIITKADSQEIDRMNDTYNDASRGGQYYISTGRMMGVTGGKIAGMASQVSKQTGDLTPILPDFDPIQPISPDELNG